MTVHDEPSAVTIDSHQNDASALPVKDSHFSDPEKRDSDIESPLEDGFGHSIHTLFPQPVDDPLDPLNWSFFQKHGILAIVMALYVASQWLCVIQITNKQLDISCSHI